jgi:hypothetical protein
MYDLLDSDRNNPDGDEKRGYMRITNLEIVPVSALNDGSILIFVKREDMGALESYIYEKSHQMWVYVNEKEGETIIDRSDNKVLMNSDDSVEEVCIKIAEFLKNEKQREIDPAYIQLFRSNE